MLLTRQQEQNHNYHMSK